MEEQKIVLVGLGNTLFGDDGFGVFLSEILEKCSKGIDIVGAGIGSLGVIDIISGYKKIILLDVCVGEAVSGGKIFEVYKLDNTSAKNQDIMGMFAPKIDMHRITPLELSVSLFSMGFLDREIYVFCVRPYRMDLGEKISSSLLDSVPEVVEALKKLVFSINGKIEVDFDCVLNKIKSYRVSSQE